MKIEKLHPSEFWGYIVGAGVVYVYWVIGSLVFDRGFSWFNFLFYWDFIFLWIILIQIYKANKK